MAAGVDRQLGVGRAGPSFGCSWPSSSGVPISSSYKTPVLWDQGPPVTLFYLHHLHHLLKSHLYLLSLSGILGVGLPRGNLVGTWVSLSQAVP